MGRMKNIHVLSQHVDKETGASLIPHPEHYHEGVSPVPPIQERAALPNFDRGLGLFNSGRGGELVAIGPSKFEYWVNSTIAQKNNGEGYRYGGQIRMDDREDVTSLSGGWCQCKSYRKKQFVYNGVVICKHMWWAALRAAHGQYQRLSQIAIHHNSGELKSVKFNGCKLREAQSDIGTFKDWVQRNGFEVWKFPGHGTDVPLDRNGLFMRVYTR